MSARKAARVIVVYIRVDVLGVVHRGPTLSTDELRTAELVIERHGSRYVVTKNRCEPTYFSVGAPGLVVSRVEADRLVKAVVAQCTKRAA